MKKKIAMCMMAALCLGSGMTTYAAPETMADGTVFDAEYYAQNNPDVVAVLGTDRAILYQHYVTYGMHEGRLANDWNVSSEHVTEQAYKPLVIGPPEVPEGEDPIEFADYGGYYIKDEYGVSHYIENLS